jgi:hypothetical protein
MDEIRFLIQDIRPSFEILQDEDLDYLISTWMPLYDSTYAVAALACEVIAARYAGQVTVTGDGVTVDTSALQDKYLKLAEQMRDMYKAARESSAPVLPPSPLMGTYDASIPPLVFGVGLHDNPEAGRQDYGGDVTSRRWELIRD